MHPNANVCAWYFLTHRILFALHFSQIFTPCGPHSSFRNSYLAPLKRSLHFLEGHRLPTASSQEIIVMFRRCFIFYLAMVPPLYDTLPLSSYLGFWEVWGVVWVFVRRVFETLLYEKCLLATSKLNHFGLDIDNLCFNLSQFVLQNLRHLLWHVVKFHKPSPPV